jgi:endonuclease/exonuclease/phosphatase family metal-dependent hydrolase
MNDLMVFSWNLQKKGLGQFENVADTVNPIVRAIANLIASGDKGGKTPFIGFLLEITGAPAKVAQMCALLEGEYEKVTGEKVLADYLATGGQATTTESIIIISRAVHYVQSEFDMRTGFADLVSHYERLANTKHEEHLKRNKERDLRSRKGNPLAPKPQHFNPLDRKPEWFRNGVIAEVRYGTNTIRITSAHAPGPGTTEKVKGVIDVIVNKAAEAGTHILIGDFNKRGSYGEALFDDLSKTWTTGSSFKKTTKALGESRWDRILVDKARTFQIEAFDPIPVTRPGSIMLTDHALVSARIHEPAAPVADLFTGVKPPAPFSLSSDIVMNEMVPVSGSAPAVVSPLAAKSVAPVVSSSASGDAASLGPPLSNPVVSSEAALIKTPAPVESNALLSPKNPASAADLGAKNIVDRGSQVVANPLGKTSEELLDMAPPVVTDTIGTVVKIGLAALTG